MNKSALLFATMHRFPFVHKCLVNGSTYARIPSHSAQLISFLNVLTALLNVSNSFDLSSIGFFQQLEGIKFDIKEDDIKCSPIYVYVCVCMTGVL